MRQLENKLIQSGMTAGACRELAGATDSTAAHPAIGDNLTHLDIIVNAFACDVTRVAAIQFGNDQKFEVDLPGLQGDQHTSFLHGSTTDFTNLGKFEVWMAQQFAAVIAKLKSRPEPDDPSSTLYDNTLMVWCRDMGDATVHNQKSMRFVIAGGAGGYLKTNPAGRYLDFRTTDLQGAGQSPRAGAAQHVRRDGHHRLQPLRRSHPVADVQDAAPRSGGVTDGVPGGAASHPYCAGPVEAAILDELTRDAPGGLRAGHWTSLAERGGRLRILRGGAGARDGETVVLLHGRGHASPIWFPCWPALAARHRVLAIDLPGFGQSAPPAPARWPPFRARRRSRPSSIQSRRSSPARSPPGALPGWRSAGTHWAAWSRSSWRCARGCRCGV